MTAPSPIGWEGWDDGADPPVVPSLLLPGIAARGPATAYTDALWAPLIEVDDRVREFVVGLLDLDEAAGVVLDLAGDLATAGDRGGLDDGPYRRIVAGRRVARERTVEPHAVYRGWTAMTEAWRATLDEAPSEVTLIGWVDYVPTSDWVARVGGVVRHLVADGTYAYGLIAQPGCFVWGINSFDDAGFGFDFGV